MSALFASGLVVDAILAVLAIEAAILLLARRNALDVTLALLPGAMLLLALRAALTGADALWVAAFLAASFPVHLADLARRGFFTKSPREG